MTEYKDGNGWRGHWLACGAMRMVIRRQKADQLELVIDD
jgi:hypothetical protein